jgi:hypothetical protein
MKHKALSSNPSEREGERERGKEREREIRVQFPEVQKYTWKALVKQRTTPNSLLFFRTRLDWPVSTAESMGIT